MGLRFDPVGGGQFKMAAQALIDAEGLPIKALNTRKGKEEARLKLFQEFKTKFQGLEKAIYDIASFRRFRELKVDLGDGAELMGVTLQKDLAEPGQYQISVDQLATRSATISTGFETAEQTVLGAGFVIMDLLDGTQTELYVDDASSSLIGLAREINRKAESPVRASVIKDSSNPDAPWKLLLTAKKEGAQNQIRAPEFYFLNAEMEFEVADDRDATNASIQINGFPIELETNDTNEFLPGVNIHLKEARPDRPFTLSISEDYPKMASKIKAIVDQVNTILQFIQKQNTVDEKTDTTTTFAGDSALQAIEFRIRNLFQKGFAAVHPKTGESVTVHMRDLGISFEKTGSLSFSEDKFTKFMEKNFELIAQAISDQDGFAAQLLDLIRSYTRSSDGFLTIKEQGLRNRVKQIDDQIDQKTRALEKSKQNIIDRFARLEGTLGGMQKQQAFLAAALPGAGGGSPISQLLG